MQVRRAIDTAREGVLSAIGNTPLVRLNQVFRDIEFKLYAKMEMLNPGGSIKDRTAISILEQGIRSGSINSDTVIIESSSGNMGIGLAQVCSFYGLRLICVVDAKTTNQNIDILRAYGAEIDHITEPDPITGEYPPGAHRSRGIPAPDHQELFLAQPVRERAQPSRASSDHARDRRRYGGPA